MHLKAFERTAGPVSPSWHTAERLPSVKLPRRAATPFTWVSPLQALPSLPLEWSHLQPLLFIALSRLYFSRKTSNLCCQDPLSVIPLEVATLSSILTWRMLWTEEPAGLQNMGLQKSQTGLSDFTTMTSGIILVVKIGEMLPLISG